MSEPLFIRVRPNNLPKPEPKPEAGSGGSAPPEGVHWDAEPRAVCLAPDVCKTKVGSTLVPVPYQVWGKAEDAQNFSTSVYFRGTPAMRFNSVFSKTYGDEPAQDKGGVKSGDRSGKVEPTSHSPTVNIQNSPAVRHRDRVTLNGGNTPGEIVLSRDQASYGSKAAPSPPATGAADEPRGMGGQFYDHSPTLQDLNAAKEKVSEWWHDPSAIGRDAQAAAEWAKSVPGDLKRAGEQAWQWATWDHVKEAPGQVWGWGKDQAQKGWAHGKDVYRKDGVGGLATAGLALGVEVFNPVEKLKMLELGTKVLKEAGALERAAHGAEHALEHAKSGDGGVRITEKKKRKRNPCHHLAKGNPNGKGPFRGGGLWRSSWVESPWS